MKNKTFGSALLVAGTTIGAGMLAMPLTSAEMGFTYTLILLFILWGLLSYSALLFVEVYQKQKPKMPESLPLRNNILAYRDVF